VGGQIHAPAALSSGKEPRYQLDTKLGRPQSRSGRGGGGGKKRSATVGNRTLVVQLVGNHYTGHVKKHQSYRHRSYGLFCVTILDINFSVL